MHHPKQILLQAIVWSPAYVTGARKARRESTWVGAKQQACATSPSIYSSISQPFLHRHFDALAAQRSKGNELLELWRDGECWSLVRFWCYAAWFWHLRCRVAALLQHLLILLWRWDVIDRAQDVWLCGIVVWLGFVHDSGSCTSGRGCMGLWRQIW